MINLTQTATLVDFTDYTANEIINMYCTKLSNAGFTLMTIAGIMWFLQPLVNSLLIPKLPEWLQETAMKMYKLLGIGLLVIAGMTMIWRM